MPAKQRDIIPRPPCSRMYEPRFFFLSSFFLSTERGVRLHRNPAIRSAPPGATDEMDAAEAHPADCSPCGRAPYIYLPSPWLVGSRVLPSAARVGTRIRRLELVLVLVLVPSGRQAYGPVSLAAIAASLGLLARMACTRERISRSLQTARAWRNYTGLWGRWCARGARNCRLCSNSQLGTIPEKPELESDDPCRIHDDHTPPAGIAHLLTYACDQ